MNRATVRAVPIRERLRIADEKVADLIKHNNALTDTLNAILEQAGGQIIVSDDHVLRATRKHVAVIPMPGYVIITTDPGKALTARPRGIREKLGLARA